MHPTNSRIPDNSNRCLVVSALTKLSIVLAFVVLLYQSATCQYGSEGYRSLLDEYTPIVLTSDLDHYLDTAGRIDYCDDCADRSSMVFFVYVMLRTSGVVYSVTPVPQSRMSYGVDVDTTMWAWKEGEAIIRNAVLQWKFKSIVDPNYIGPLTFGVLTERGSIVPKLLLQGTEEAHATELFCYGLMITLGAPIVETVLNINVK